MGTFLEWLLGLEKIQDIGEGYAVLVSSCLVIIGWYISRVGQAKSDRVQNSISFVSVKRDKDLQEALSKVKDIINNRQIFNEPPGTDKFRAMLGILQQLEYQSASIRTGLISEEFIDKTERTFIQTVFRSCSPYIHQMRVERGAPTIMENLESVFLRSFIRGKNPGIFILELILSKPLFALTLKEFRFNYWLLRSIHSIDEHYLKEDWVRLKRLHSELRKIQLLVVTLAVLAALVIF
jgi:hypothetical protein